MDESQGPKSDALRALFWRSELLQVLYWLRGEGLGDVADAELVERFLGIDAGIGVTYLGQLAEEGYLERRPGGFALSPQGLRDGATEFAMSFSDLTRPAHGECSADCWCHVSADEAAACAAERAGHLR